MSYNKANFDAKNHETIISHVSILLESMNPPLALQKIPKYLFLLKNDFQTMLFLFFSHFASGVGGFWKVRKIPHFFETFP